jgi:hypothetical protein
MIGDIVLGIKKFFHQHVLCIHKYKWVYRRDKGPDFEVCDKCNKIR